MRPKRYRKKATNSQENRQIRSLDQLAAFDEFRASILPALMRDVNEGSTDDELLEKYRAIAQARVISEMVLPGGQGLAAAKDILDRSRGKAVERKEFKHQLEKLEEKDVDALLMSKLAQLNPGDPGTEE
jgi:hypothetical protein